MAKMVDQNGNDVYSNKGDLKMNENEIQTVVDAVLKELEKVDLSKKESVVLVNSWILDDGESDDIDFEDMILESEDGYSITITKEGLSKLGTGKKEYLWLSEDSVIDLVKFALSKSVVSMEDFE